MEQLEQSPKEQPQAIEEVRGRALDAATKAFADNRLSLEQYESTAAKIQNALTISQIKASMQGIDGLDASSLFQGTQEALSPKTPRTVKSESQQYDLQEKAPDFYFCIMGERKLDGRTIRSTNVASITVMGSTVIDLRGVSIPTDGLHLDIIAVMGETKVLVSPGTEVRFSVIPVMGEAANKMQRIHDEPYEGSIVIGGIALMGSVRVVEAA